jgi:hypothetical protein
MWILLILLFIAASQSMAELLQGGRHTINWFRPAFYSVTPMAFALLLWMASIAIREGQLRLPPALSQRLPRWLAV